MTAAEVEDPVSASVLVERAAALAPALSARAAETERMRRVPDESVRDLASVGLLRIGNPDRYGGYGAAGVEYDTVFDVEYELGAGCGATAWCYAQWVVHSWLIGHFPAEAQDEVFASGPDTLASSAFHAVQAKAEPEADGLRLSGRWEFSSGCDAASWALLSAPGEGGQLRVLVPRSDVHIIDTWYVSGLRGTGSKDIAVEDALVPRHRVLNMALAGTSDRTGWNLHRRLSYRVPAGVLMGWQITMPMLGMARGALDAFASRLRGLAGADAAGGRFHFAEAAAEIAAARALHRQDIREILNRAEREEAFSALDQARYRRDKAFIARQCVEAMNRLFDASGGHALFDSNPLQRLHRDIHAAAHQGGQNWDVARDQYSQAVLAELAEGRPSHR